VTQRHRHAVVVTGMGAVSALGEGCKALWRGIAEGRTGIGPIRRFSTDGLDVSIAATVPGCDDFGGDPEVLCHDFAVRAAREALADARVDLGVVSTDRIAVALGASMGEGGRDPCGEVAALADELGLHGPRITVSTACASSLTAIGLGRDLLDTGEAGLVLAGGADVLTPRLLAGFAALGALGTRPCAPFSFPFGTTLGEGAGFVVLERLPDATRRGARPRCAVLGYGLSGDAHHETSPHPRGEGVARALRWALDDAGLQPTAIGYVNAHGTGTAANDGAEWQALREVLGPHAGAIPVSSTKGHIGHAQGAAGALEAITTVMALEQRAVPPTAGFTRRRPSCPVDPVFDSGPRGHDFDHAVTQNSAFGGANCAVVLGRNVTARERPAPHGRPRPVLVLGAGALGPHGTDLDDLLDALVERRPLSRAPIDADVRRFLRHADDRGLDPAGKHLAIAATLALRDAGVDDGGPLHGQRRTSTGLVVGMTRTSPTSANELQRSIDERGLARVSAGAFSRMVLNASQGSCAKLMAIKGPQTTLAAGPASGLIAVCFGAHALASRAEADLMVAGAVEEAERDPSHRGPAEDGAGDHDANGGCEGAACLVLGAGAAVPGTAPTVRVSGWAIAGPGRVDRAVSTALERAEVAPHEVGAVLGPGCDRADTSRPWRPDCLRVDPTPAIGRLGGVGSALACAAAVAWLRRPANAEGASVVVVDPGDRTVSCAVVLTRIATSAT
jgi:3-oxoacyl-[acyl-carrier-protein] synthase II